MVLGDGEIEIEIESVSNRDVRGRVAFAGLLKDEQGVHFPGVTIEAEPITEKDRRDLSLGIRLGVDYVALSFVRTGDDVLRIKKFIEAQGAMIPVIAKLEKHEAIQSLDDILAAADGVMVARGDLGLELPLERVPLLQKEIIRSANERGVLVITATQMLESMVTSPRPTRAEASDVANAVLDGTDAVMLSAETAIGRYPLRSVEMMARIAREAETALGRVPAPVRRTYAHALSVAACDLAREAGVAAIVALTKSGYSAQLLSKGRPNVPIFAFTESSAVYRNLNLWWGVQPVLTDLPRPPRI